ncbi:hypothetical protein DPMN_143370 [Dreissena polymorpha]|uniref:Uncharacterized protein n=1 Tax=Dreissena polymorpha TaxID=45954 RepID=A0A9D4GDG6_DREPO|nr:hypothetical protein DPMN_143370 [Dreissena polymorpha]
MCTYENIQESNAEYQRRDEMVKANLLNVHQRIKEFKSHRETYIDIIETQQKQVISEAQDIAQQLIEKIKALATNVEDTVSRHVNTETNITKENINDADHLYMNVKRITDLFEVAQRHGNAEQCILVSRHIDYKAKEILSKMNSLESPEDKHFALAKTIQINKLDSICYVTFSSKKHQSKQEDANDEVAGQLPNKEKDKNTSISTSHHFGSSSDLSVVMCNKEVQTIDTAAQSSCVGTLASSPPSFP